MRELATSWARRSLELKARIRDLHERNIQLSAGSGPPDLELRRTVGSTPDQVARARAAAQTASTRAREAIQRIAMMRLHAAAAHDRAAQWHETLAGAGCGDVPEHRDRAATHRRLAGEDRAAAEAMFRGGYAQRPGSWPG